MAKDKTQVFIIHGGMTFKNKKDYLKFLKTREISIEKKIRWTDDWLDKKLGKDFEMRRTGGTHVYDVAKTLFGNNWEKKCFVVSQDNFCYGKRKLNKKQIVDKMKEVLYPIKGAGEGVIISIINKWKPTFGFIIVSKSNKKAMDIYSKIQNIWAIKN